MTDMIRYSSKAWVLAVGTPIVAFLWESALGALLAVVLVAVCTECRRRFAFGARGREILLIHRGHDHER